MRQRLGAPRSRCDIPRRAPHRLWAGGRAAGGRAPGSGVGAGPLASRPRNSREGRRGRGRVCGGAWRRGAAALAGPGSAPARAPRRSLCVARTPGTGDSHRHWLPPLALTRSPASPPPPPPPRRPNPPARPDPRGRERARRAPGREGAAGGGGGETRRARQTAAGCDCEAWGRAWFRSRRRGRPGGRRRGREAMWVGETRWALRPAHSLPFLFCLLPQPGHPCADPRSRYPEDAGLSPPSASSPRTAGSGAPTPHAEPGPGRVFPAARSHALGPSRRDTCRDPPRGAARGVAPARGGVFGEKRPPRACVRSSDPRGGSDFSHWSPAPALFLSILGERVVILGPCRAFLG